MLKNLGSSGCRGHKLCGFLIKNKKQQKQTIKHNNRCCPNCYNCYYCYQLLLLPPTLLLLPLLPPLPPYMHPLPPSPLLVLLLHYCCHHCHRFDMLLLILLQLHNPHTQPNKPSSLPNYSTHTHSSPATSHRHHSQHPIHATINKSISNTHTHSSPASSQRHHSQHPIHATTNKSISILLPLLMVLSTHCGDTPGIAGTHARTDNLNMYRIYRKYLLAKTMSRTHSILPHWQRIFKLRQSSKVVQVSGSGSDSAVHTAKHS